jgi:putative addiction module component (TIGR02574 family)
VSDAAESILQAALKLSEEERAKLADALLESLPPEEDLVEVSEEVLFTELERRRTELEKDPSAALPWSEVKRMME